MSITILQYLFAFKSVNKFIEFFIVKLEKIFVFGSNY